jgi:hypothetical protein
MAEIGVPWLAAAIIGPASIAVILILSHLAKKPDQFVRLPMYMFFSLSIFALCLIVVISFFPQQTDAENFPIAMMKNYNGTQWVINVGGVKEANSTGIQIPVYIIVLGILGAYVRYLYSGIKEFKMEFRDDLRRYGRTFDKIRQKIDEIKRTIDLIEASIPELPTGSQTQVRAQRDVYVGLRERKENELNRNGYNLSMDVTSHILNTVGFFLLGPLLAVMGWLVLLLSNATNQWIFALVALTVGFTANSIVSRATSMAGDKLSIEKAKVEVETETGKASVALSANKGSTGTKITIAGEGFSSQSGISLRFNDEEPQTEPEEIKTNAQGKFSASFTVPELEVGEYELILEDDEGKTASAAFTLTN